MTKPYSHIYDRSEVDRSDDKRARRRLMHAFRDYLGTNNVDFASFLEKELGIEIIESNYSGTWVNWESLFLQSTKTDLFDAIYFCHRFLSISKRYGPGVPRKFLTKCQRIFKERQLAYRIDDSGTVHPFVDDEFLSSIVVIIRNLEDRHLSAARDNIAASQRFLLDTDQDFRMAIRAVFDAAENIWKQLVIGAIRLDSKSLKANWQSLATKSAINTGLNPTVLSKQEQAFSAWIEACHFFRNDAGKPDTVQPNEAIAIQLISQGLPHVRALADLHSRIEE